MTSTDGGRGPEPLDPDFEGLFRPDEPGLAPAPPRPPMAEPVAVPVAEPTEDADEPHFEPVLDPVVDPRVEDALHDASVAEAAAGIEADVSEPAPAAPPVSEPSVDTGRLFRSQGVAGHGDAVLALPSDHGGRLRTLDRQSDDPAAPPAVAVLEPISAPTAAEADAAALLGLGTATALEAEPAGSDHTPRSDRRRGHRARSITGGAVYIIVIGVTVLVGFANALIADGDIGWPTGIALLVSSVYAALTVRRADDIVAVIIPPVAFFLAAITAGQLFVGSLEGSILNRAAILFFTLADNWIWIIGATVASLVIVLVRRRRA